MRGGTQNFNYVAHWSQGDSSEPGSFTLNGVIAVGADGCHALFPSDAVMEDEWNSLLQGLSPDEADELLEAMAGRGDGVLEEYGPVDRIQASKVREAATKALERTAVQYGKSATLYERLPLSSPIPIGNPLEGSIPDALLYGEPRPVVKTVPSRSRPAPPRGLGNDAKRAAPLLVALGTVGSRNRVVVLFAAATGVAALCLVVGFPLVHLGRALLFACSAYCLAGFVGFLFGIPKSSSAQPQAPGNSSLELGGRGADHPTSLAQATSASSRYVPNTNLEEISDWITKILVGLGLVNLARIPSAVEGIARAARASFPSPVPAEPTITALLIVGSALGFLSGYMVTRVFSVGLREPGGDPPGALPPADEAVQAIVEEVAKDYGPSSDLVRHPDVALEEVRRMADHYLGIDDPDPDRRITAKNASVSQMAALIPRSNVDRATLAALNNEGIWAGLAAAMVVRPSNSDADLLLSFAGKAVRLHLQYQIVLAVGQLARQGLVTPDQAARLQDILDGYVSHADDSLRLLVHSTQPELKSARI